MLTHLLTQDDLDSYRAELVSKASDAVANTAASDAYLHAVVLLDRARSASFQRRTKTVYRQHRKTQGVYFPR